MFLSMLSVMVVVMVSVVLDRKSGSTGRHTVQVVVVGVLSGGASGDGGATDLYMFGSSAEEGEG